MNKKHTCTLANVMLIFLEKPLFLHIFDPALSIVPRVIALEQKSVCGAADGEAKSEFVVLPIKPDTRREN